MISPSKENGDRYGLVIVSAVAGTIMAWIFMNFVPDQSLHKTVEGINREFESKYYVSENIQKNSLRSIRTYEDCGVAKDLINSYLDKPQYYADLIVTDDAGICVFNLTPLQFFSYARIKYNPSSVTSREKAFSYQINYRQMYMYQLLVIFTSLLKWLLVETANKYVAGTGVIGGVVVSFKFAGELFATDLFIVVLGVAFFGAIYCLRHGCENVRKKLKGGGASEVGD